MQRGKILALVIIMLSALEERFWIFFGVFNDLKSDQKELLQLTFLADIAH